METPTSPIPKRAEGQICIPIKRLYKPDKRTAYVLSRLDSAEGSFGQIWQACMEKDCTYILKYQPYKEEDELLGTPKVDREFVLNEVRMHKMLSDLGLAPKLVDSWLCENGGVMIMKALSITVSSYIKHNIDNERDCIAMVIKCLGLLNKLHILGYYHGDSHIDNMMLDRRRLSETGELEEFTPYRLYFIDMGLSDILPEDKEEKLLKIKNDYIIFGTSLHEYYDRKYEEFKASSQKIDKIRNIYLFLSNCVSDYAMRL